MPGVFEPELWTENWPHLFSDTGPPPNRVIWEAIHGLLAVSPVRESVDWIYLFAIPNREPEPETEDDREGRGGSGIFPSSRVFQHDVEVFVGPADAASLPDYLQALRDPSGKQAMNDFLDEYRHGLLQPYSRGEIESDDFHKSVPIERFVAISLPESGKSGSFIRAAAIWIGCSADKEERRILEDRLKWPLRSLLSETVSALTFGAFGAAVSEFDSHQEDHRRNREIAQYTTRISPHLRALHYLIKRTPDYADAVNSEVKHMMNSDLRERYQRPSQHVPTRGTRIRGNCVFQHDWFEIRTVADQESLATQVAFMIQSFSGFEQVDVDLAILSVASNEFLAAFESLDDCFSILRRTDCANNIAHSGDLLKCFKLLKRLFFRPFQSETEGLTYGLIALWAASRGVGQEEVRKLRTLYSDRLDGIPKRVPIELLVGLDALANEVQPVRSVVLPLRLDVEDVGEKRRVIVRLEVSSGLRDHVRKYQESSSRDPTHSLEWAVAELRRHEKHCELTVREGFLELKIGVPPIL